jgi:hydroxypyruvate reductase
MARALQGKRATLVALASDGSDGPTDAAGAEINGDSWRTLRSFGDPEDHLARADAYPLLDAAGLLLRTGPTGTNLCDLHVLTLDP